MVFSPYGNKFERAPQLVPADAPGLMALTNAWHMRRGKDPRQYELGPQNPENPYATKQVASPAGIGAARMVQQAAPPGEQLAYINPQEAQMLKQAGGSGRRDNNPFGIMSFDSFDIDDNLSPQEERDNFEEDYYTDESQEEFIPGSSSDPFADLYTPKGDKYGYGSWSTTNLSPKDKYTLDRLISGKGPDQPGQQGGDLGVDSTSLTESPKTTSLRREEMQLAIKNKAAYDAGIASGKPGWWDNTTYSPAVRSEIEAYAAGEEEPALESSSYKKTTYGDVGFWGTLADFFIPGVSVSEAHDVTPTDAKGFQTYNPEPFNEWSPALGIAGLLGMVTGIPFETMLGAVGVGPKTMKTDYLAEMGGDLADTVTGMFKNNTQTGLPGTDEEAKALEMVTPKTEEQGLIGDVIDAATTGVNAVTGLYGDAFEGARSAGRATGRTLRGWGEDLAKHTGIDQLSLPEWPDVNFKQFAGDPNAIGGGWEGGDSGWERGDNDLNSSGIFQLAQAAPRTSGSSADTLENKGEDVVYSKRIVRPEYLDPAYDWASYGLQKGRKSIFDYV